MYGSAPVALTVSMALRSGGYAKSFGSRSYLVLGKSLSLQFAQNPNSSGVSAPHFRQTNSKAYHEEQPGRGSARLQMISLYYRSVTFTCQVQEYSITVNERHASHLTRDHRQVECKKGSSIFVDLRAREVDSVLRFVVISLWAVLLAS
jgi:hypothetical protein